MNPFDSESFLTFANALPQIVWAATREGVLNYTNQRWTDYSGSDVPELWITFVHPEDQPFAIERWNEAILTGEPYELEFRLRRVDGTYRWHLVRANPLHGFAGEVEKWLGTCTDIQLRKNSEDDLKIARREVEAERQKLEGLFVNTPASMALFRGPNHLFEKVNARYRSLRSERKYIGRPISEVVPELSGQPFLQIMDDVYRTGVSYVGKDVAAYVQKSPELAPELRYFDITYSRTEDESGKSYGTLVHAIDVTENVLSRRKTELSEVRNRQAVEAAKLGFWTYDLLEEKVYLSDELVEQHGLPRISNGGSLLEALHTIHPVDRTHVINALLESQKSKQRYRIEYRVMLESSPPRWIESHGECFSDAKGNAIRITGTTLDISDRKATEQQLENAKEEAEAANEAKSTFLANMSHEIRTPLGAVMGFAELLKRPNLDRKTIDHYITIIDRNSEQLLRIIDDILDLSKVEAGKMTVENLDFDLSEMLSECASFMEFKALEKGIGFRFFAETSLPSAVKTDPVRLRQILMNVLGNAIKFTAKGFVETRISFQDGLLEFTVEDTGIGISEEHRKGLFTPFSQADESTTREFGGTGLGLSLTKRLSAALGGDFILLSSELGKGSTFKTWVRIEVPEHAVLVEKMNFVFDIKDTTAPVESSEIFSDLKILVVDDAPDNRILISTVLSELGATVGNASDGLEAIEKIESEKFDLVLMDIQMPRLDGHEATRSLRRSGIKIPIIALTAHAMNEEKIRCESSGFSGFLTKPLSKPALVNEILKHTKMTNKAEIDILLIEDDQDIRESLCEFLSSDDLRIASAEDGPTALEYLESNPLPPLVLVDLSLPGMSGEELIGHLNAHADRKHTKLVIASGWDQLKTRAEKLGADTFLRKPYDLMTLTSFLKKLMQ